MSCGRWEQYLTVRETLQVMEDFFARQYLSKPLLQVFRDESQSGNYRTSQHKYLCNLLRAVEVRCLKANDPTSAMQLAYAESAPPQHSSNKFGSAFGSIADYEHYYLTDIVNSIKQNPDDFAEWHASETAKLYEPTIFENKKCDKGYWF